MSLFLMSQCRRLFAGFGWVAHGMFSFAGFRLPAISDAPDPKTEVLDHQAGEDYRRYQKTQLGLLRSRLVFNAALLKEDTGKLPMLKNLEDPVTWALLGVGVALAAPRRSAAQATATEAAAVPQVAAGSSG